MKNSIRSIVGILIFLVTVVGAIILDSGILLFIHFPCFLIVIFAGGGLGLASYKGGGFQKYLAACKKYFIPAGVLGTVIGVIPMLQNLSSPEHLGMGMAIMLLPVFYAIVLYCVCDAVGE